MEEKSVKAFIERTSAKTHSKAANKASRCIQCILLYVANGNVTVHMRTIKITEPILIFNDIGSEALPFLHSIASYSTGLKQDIIPITIVDNRLHISLSTANKPHRSTYTLSNFKIVHINVSYHSHRRAQVLHP